MKATKRMTTRGIRREVSDRVVGTKLTPTLVSLIERDGKAEGIGLSGIIRRILMQHYRDELARLSPQ